MDLEVTKFQLAAGFGSAANWKDAIFEACNLLVNIGVMTEEYVEACISAVVDNGPYIVLSPGIALAHARPEKGALDNGLSVLVLDEPVEFGHKSNDPVGIVIAFCCEDNMSHIDMIKNLGSSLVSGLASKIVSCDNISELELVLRNVCDQ